MEIDEAIRAYIGLTDDVFLTPPWYKALWHKFCPKQPLFNSTKLMDAAKKIVIERNLAEDTLFLQNDSSCKT
jgi:hypothetical protein